MKFILEKINDFFYNFFDYILALILIVIAALTIFTSYNKMIDNVADAKIQDTIANESQTEEKTKSFTISIPEIISDETLANILKSYALIDSEEDFISYFNQNANIENVKSGQVTLDTSMDYDEIIENITK